jgi:hypothetical protein
MAEHQALDLNYLHHEKFDILKSWSSSHIEMIECVFYTQQLYSYMDTVYPGEGYQPSATKPTNPLTLRYRSKHEAEPTLTGGKGHCDLERDVLINQPRRPLR